MRNQKKYYTFLKEKLSTDFNLEIIQMLESSCKNFKAADICLCIFDVIEKHS